MYRDKMIPNNIHAHFCKNVSISEHISIILVSGNVTLRSGPSKFLPGFQSHKCKQPDIHHENRDTAISETSIIISAVSPRIFCKLYSPRKFHISYFGLAGLCSLFAVDPSNTSSPKADQFLTPI